MDPLPPCYIGFADGASRWSPNLASAAWVLYSPSNERIHLDGTCIGAATNNQAEYDAVTGLLSAALQMGISHLHVFLDSQLLVSQLNNCYQVCDPCLFRKFLRTKQLSQQFESIRFTHVPRAYNSVVDQMANNVLDWHINHIM